MNLHTYEIPLPEPSATSQWQKALYKDRWVEITVRYDDYQRFITGFVLPFTQQLQESKHIKSFYHCLASDCDEVLHLNLHTSQHHFQQFAPSLFEALTEYFGPSFLSQFKLEKLDDTALSAKAGFTTYHWPSFGIIGIEAFSFDRFPFTKGMHGKRELAYFLSVSAEYFLERSSTQKPQGYDAFAEHYHYCLSVVRVFTMQHRRCLHWLLISTRKQIGTSMDAGNGIPPFLNPYKFIHPLSHPLEKLKSELDVLDQDGLLHIWEYQQDPSETEILRDLGAQEAMRWRIISYLVHTGLGQSGIRLNERYAILQSLSASNSFS